MSNIIIPPYSIIDINYDKNITLKLCENSLSNKMNQSKSLDLINLDTDDSDEIYKISNNQIRQNNLISNIESHSNSISNENNKESDEEERHKVLLDNHLTEKLLQNILGINKQKSNKRKVGMLKEGYLQFYGINPINRYNFTIDRYNEDTNIVSNIKLTRIPIPKIISRFFDLFIFLSRILLGVFLIISYYFSSYIYRKNSNNMNKARLITYKKYLLNDNNFYTQSDKPSCILVFVCIIFILFSIFVIFSLYFVMLIPNVLFTFYLGLAVIVNFINERRIKSKAENIFENMIFENKLDDKDQLNDYIKLNKLKLKHYKGFPYYEKLKEVYKRKGKNDNIYVMLYGNLFVREHEIINKGFLNQFIGFGVYLLIGYFIYYNKNISTSNS